MGMTSLDSTIIYSGHSSLGSNTDDDIDLTQFTVEKYFDLTTFILPEGYKFITISRYSCPIFANTTDYFLLWGLKDSHIVHDLDRLFDIKNGRERNNLKKDIIRRMVKNFLVKALSNVKTNTLDSFK